MTSLVIAKLSPVHGQPRTAQPDTHHLSGKELVQEAVVAQRSGSGEGETLLGYGVCESQRLWVLGMKWGKEAMGCQVSA